MNDMWFRLGFKLRTDNNARCAAMWIIVVTWLIFNLFVVGIGPSGFDDFQSVAEKAYLGEEAAGESWLAGLWDLFGSASWWGWVLWVIVTLVYTPIAFRDEVARAVESFRGKRGAGAQTSAPAGDGGVSRGRPMTFRDFLKWDLIVEVITAIGGRLFGRR